MKGLYRGKYLIVYYDKDGYPSIIEDSAQGFYEACRKISKKITRASVDSLLSRIATGKRNLKRIKLIEADTVINDCFKEADEDFIKMYKEMNKYPEGECGYYMKLYNISARTYARWKKEGLLDVCTKNKHLNI